MAGVLAGLALTLAAVGLIGLAILVLVTSDSYWKALPPALMLGCVAFVFLLSAVPFITT